MTRPRWPFQVATPEAGSAQKDEVILSDSGAVLGRPDLEYGAYGMVKPQAGTPAPRPTPTEYEIRGVYPDPDPTADQEPIARIQDR